MWYHKPTFAIILSHDLFSGTQGTWCLISVYLCSSAPSWWFSSVTQVRSHFSHLQMWLTILKYLFDLYLIKSVPALARSINATGLNNPNIWPAILAQSIMAANYTGLLPIKSLKLTVEVTKCYVRVLYQSNQDILFFTMLKWLVSWGLFLWNCLIGFAAVLNIWDSLIHEQLCLLSLCVCVSVCV